MKVSLLNYCNTVFDFSSLILVVVTISKFLKLNLFVLTMCSAAKENFWCFFLIIAMKN